MQELSIENLDTVSNNGAGQDSADYNGPDGGQDYTQWGYGPDTIEFRAYSSASAFFNWAGQFSNAGSDIYSLVAAAPTDTSASLSVANYVNTHNGGGAGLDSGQVGDIIVRAYNTTFGTAPMLDLYSVWFTSNLYGESGSTRELGTLASDFTLVGATADDVAQFQEALNYLHGSPQAAALLKWCAANNISIHFVSNGEDRYDPVGRTVYWDPRSGLDLQNGRIQSPALGLIHEIGHAYGDPVGVPIIHYLPGDPNIRYNTLQEFHDITNIETPIAIELGEGFRFNHDSQYSHPVYVVDSVFHM